MLRTNLIGPYLVTRAFLPHVMVGRRRIVVNMSSRLGSIELNVEGGFYAYRTSKTALNMMTRNWAVDFRNTGVAFVALHPGRVQTELGGADASLPVAVCVAQLLQTIEKLGPHDSGTFIDLYGNRLSW